MRRVVLLCFTLVAAVAVGLVGPVALAFPQLGVPTSAAPQRVATERYASHAFTFTRGRYSGRYGGGGFRGRGRWGGNTWAIDYPEADRHFVIGLKRMTNVDVDDWENPVTLDDPDLNLFPVLYILEVGDMSMTEAEVEGLRRYLRAGGFLIIDDFWGSWEWANFESEIRRVFPDLPIVELPLDHPIFHIYYDIDEIIQVPNVGQGRRGGPTWENDGYVPHCLAIFDEQGRMLAVINWNTDLGDAWEWADDPYYPLHFSTYAWEMGINFVLYGMSH
ncbi:DUF4159 domain-containing protein [Gemmatimonadota bacterium]